MENNWQNRKIGELGKVVTGKTPSTKDPENFGGDFPFITIPDLDGRVFIDYSARTLSDIGARKMKSLLLPPNSVMMSCIATIGKCGITRKSSFTNQQINSVICKENINPKYLYYIFSQLGYELEASGGGGSVYSNVSKSRFSDIEIPVPPLTEQRCIAGILGALDEKIELNRRMNATLESMARAVFRQWFVENEEVNNWEIGRVGDLCQPTIGGDWGEDKEFEDGIPVICLRGVDLENLRRSGFSEDAPIRWIKKSSLEKRELSDHDILIAGSGIGPVGRPLWVCSEMLNAYSYPVIYSNFVKRFHAKSYEYAVYVDRVLFNMRESNEIWDYVNGTSIPNLNVNDLLAYCQISIPPEKLVKDFYEYVRPIFAKLYNKESRTLASLRDSLLPKLMKGEVRVKDLILHD